MKQHTHVLIALLLCAAVLLTGCTSGGQESSLSPDDSTVTDGSARTLYYTDEDHLRIGFITVNIPSGQSRASQVSTMVGYLLDPSNAPGGTADMVSVIGGSLLQDIQIEQIQPPDTQNELDETASPDYRVVLRLSYAYYNLSPSSRVILRTGVSQSLFSLDGIGEVTFQAPDRSDTSQMLTVDTARSTDKVIINQYEGDLYTDTVYVTLYFSNADHTALVPESRVLTLNMTDSLPRAIIRALISGPQEEGHEATIPDGTTLNDLMIEDRVCYIDFSQEFQLNHEGGEMEEKLTIYSIVDSLRAVTGFDKVQIMIDGKIVPYYKNYVRLDTFLTPDDTLIQSGN